MLAVTRFFNIFKGKKQFQKGRKLIELGLNEDVIRKFSEKETETVIKEIDCLAYASDHNISENDLEDCLKYKHLDEEKVPNGYSTKKVIKKYHMSESDIEKYATKISYGRFENIKIGSLLRYLQNHNQEKCSVFQIIRYQDKYLGYIDKKEEDLEWRYIYVTKLNAMYSPKFSAYCICNGKSQEMKVHKTIPRNDKRCKTSFQQLPFKDGDVLYIKDWKREPKKQKTANGWEAVPGAFEWWIKDYRIVERGDDGEAE